MSSANSIAGTLRAGISVRASYAYSDLGPEIHVDTTTSTYSQVDLDAEGLAHALHHLPQAATPFTVDFETGDAKQGAYRFSTALLYLVRAGHPPAFWFHNKVTFNAEVRYVMPGFQTTFPDRADVAIWLSEYLNNGRFF